MAQIRERLAIPTWHPWSVLRGSDLPVLGLRAVDLWLGTKSSTRDLSERSLLPALSLFTTHFACQVSLERVQLPIARFHHRRSLGDTANVSTMPAEKKTATKRGKSAANTVAPEPMEVVLEDSINIV